MFLGDSGNKYVESKIQCNNNTRPSSRSNIASPLIMKQTFRKPRHNKLNLSKRSINSKNESCSNIKNKRSSSRKPVLRRKDILNSKVKPPKYIQRTSSCAKMSLQSQCSANKLNSTRPPRSSNIIQSKFSVVEYLNTLKEKISSKIWSDRYEICTKVIQVIKDQFGKLENTLSTPISPTHLNFTDSEYDERSTSEADVKNSQVASTGICEIITPLLSDSHFKVQMKCQSALYLLF